MHDLTCRHYCHVSVGKGKPPIVNEAAKEHNNKNLDAGAKESRVKDLNSLAGRAIGAITGVEYFSYTDINRPSDNQFLRFPFESLGNFLNDKCIMSAMVIMYYHNLFMLKSMRERLESFMEKMAAGRGGIGIGKIAVAQDDAVGQMALASTAHAAEPTPPKAKAKAKAKAKVEPKQNPKPKPKAMPQERGRGHADDRGHHQGQQYPRAAPRAYAPGERDAELRAQAGSTGESERWRRRDTQYDSRDNQEEERASGSDQRPAPPWHQDRGHRRVDVRDAQPGSGNRWQPSAPWSRRDRDVRDPP